MRNFNRIGIHHSSKKEMTILTDINRKKVNVNSDILGEGFSDIVKNLYNKGKSLAQNASNFYKSETGTALRNMIPDSDNTARPGYPGEAHAILKLKNGKYGIGNYIGPGTQIEKRILRNDPGRTPVDSLSKAHDIRYSLATELQQIRDADNIYLKGLKQIELNKSDSQHNINLAKLIKLKVASEDLGLLKKNAFSGNLDSKNMSSETKSNLMNALKPLEQQGYGNMLPGDALKLELLKRHKKQIKGISSSRDLGGNYEMIDGSGLKLGGKGIKLSGSGLKLAGKQCGKGIGNTIAHISDMVLPSLLKKFKLEHINLPENVISNIFNSVNKDDSINSIIKKVSPKILQILTELHKSGSGRKKFKISKTNKRILLNLLSKAIKKSMVSRTMGNGIRGDGMMKGNGFWSDFYRGFKSVFKPGAKILGTVASAVGLPEFGAPLSAISELM